MWGELSTTRLTKSSWKPSIIPAMATANPTPMATPPTDTRVWRLRETRCLTAIVIERRMA